MSFSPLMSVCRLSALSWTKEETCASASDEVVQGRAEVAALGGQVAGDLRQHLLEVLDVLLALVQGDC